MAGNNVVEEDNIISEINLTPLVDVSLVLVIIFMLVAPFFSKILKPLILPDAAKASLNDQNTIKVSVFPDGTLAVNTVVVSEAEMGPAILNEVANGKSPWVLVRAGVDIPYGRVMAIVKMVKKSGVSRIAFATRPKNIEEKTGGGAI